MARLPYVESATAPDDVREILEQLPVQLNIFRMLAHAETCFRPLLRLGTAILSRQQLDPKLREFAVLQAAALTPGEYEWVQHVPIARATGASEDQIAALERGDLGADCFDPRERAVLHFSADVIQRARVSDARFADVQKHLDAREIVELILTCGFYMTMARLTEVTETDTEPAVGTRVVDSLG